MATPDAPTTAQALLALYGELDRAVVRTSSSEVAAIVERYLPGSTGTNAGWYDELLGFLGRNADSTERVPAPNLREALTVLQAQAATAAPSTKARRTRGKKAEAEPTKGVQAQASYVAGGPETPPEPS
jgi:hypothetical protein